MKTEEQMEPTLSIWIMTSLLCCAGIKVQQIRLMQPT
jgi:hypothetical protein